MDTKQFADQVRAILAEEMQGFWFQVSEYQFLNEPCVSIQMGCKDHLINGVAGQRPQQVALTYGYGELKSHYPVVYRQPDRTKDDEKYLAMRGVKVPFRKPRAGKELEAVRKFAKAYKETLRSNVDTLMYQEYVDYKTLLK
jgi:hypothetical protein